MRISHSSLIYSPMNAGDCIMLFTATCHTRFSSHPICRETGSCRFVVTPGEKQKHWLRLKYPCALHYAPQRGSSEVLICAVQRDASWKLLASHQRTLQACPRPARGQNSLLLSSVSFSINIVFKLAAVINKILLSPLNKI